MLLIRYIQSLTDTRRRTPKTTNIKKAILVQPIHLISQSLIVLHFITHNKHRLQVINGIIPFPVPQNHRLHILHRIGHKIVGVLREAKIDLLMRTPQLNLTALLDLHIYRTLTVQNHQSSR